MGMDIYGNDPTEEVGEYFRANIWSWPAILGVAKTANTVADLQLDMEGWNWNDGHGLSSQAECDVLANAMQRLLDSVETPLLTAEHDPTAAMMVQTFGEISGVKQQAETSVGHAQAFISFLRKCGGFKIW